MIRYNHTFTTAQKIEAVKSTKAFKQINALNIHISMKRKELMKRFNLTLSECKTILN